jgi:heme A synthase
MAFLLALHFNLVPLIWLCGGLATVWGIVLLIRRRGIDRVLRILLGITAGLGIVEAALGGILWLSGARPADQLHYVYGLIVLAAIPVAFTYTSDPTKRRDLIVLIIAAVVVAAAAVRAFMTGCAGVCH